jgi:DNA-binding transcriptional regulator YbjK
MFFFQNLHTDFICSLQQVYVNVTTRLHTEFLSQVQKQREDSAMVLASTQKTGKQRGEKLRERYMRMKDYNLVTQGRKQRKTKWAFRKCPITRLYTKSFRKL